MAEVRLEGVTKRFGATVAADDLSLTVGHGEFVVLLGPTGAGKTTALRLAAGLERPDSGRVLIGGRDVTLLSPADRDVTFVFQQYSLYPHYTVYDNLAFPLRSPLRRRPEGEIRERVTRVAQMLRIDAKLANRATRLSGGEMQRVAIGRALVREPAIYLMDEPLSSLDAKLRAEMRVELKRIQVDLGATILYVTHDQIEAMTLADRIGVLSEGRLVQIGAPKTIYDAPDTLYVAYRLGSPRINLLPPGLLGIAAPAGTATVGVRPEAVQINPAASVGTQATAQSVEHLGAETVVLLEVGGQQLHALVDPGVVIERGERVRIAVPPGGALFFDAAGNRIPQSPAAPAAARPYERNPYELGGVSHGG